MIQVNELLTFLRETGIPTTDFGVPTLATNSILKLACVQDIPQLIAVLQAFYRRLG